MAVKLRQRVSTPGPAARAIQSGSFQRDNRALAPIHKGVHVLAPEGKRLAPLGEVLRLL